jgi:hypothetical protein
MRRLTIAALAVCIPSFVLGQGTHCDERDNAVAFLKQKYGETRQSAGLTGAGILETFANPDSGTFTVMLTNVDGIACMIASGTDWRKTRPEPEGVRL